MRSATDEKWLLKLLQISSIVSHFLPSDNWVSSKLWLENTFSYTCILPEEVLTELLKLNIHKSSGLDGISPNILKMLATVIYESTILVKAVSRECLDLKPD
jgi:hypothetical protein